MFSLVSKTLKHSQDRKLSKRIKVINNFWNYTIQSKHFQIESMSYADYNPKFLFPLKHSHKSTYSRNQKLLEFSIFFSHLPTDERNKFVELTDELINVSLIIRDRTKSQMSKNKLLNLIYYWQEFMKKNNVKLAPAIVSHDFTEIESTTKVQQKIKNAWDLINEMEITGDVSAKEYAQEVKELLSSPIYKTPVKVGRMPRPKNLKDGKKYLKLLHTYQNSPK